MVKTFIEKIIIKNRAPFEDLNLSFMENEIAVFTAINGRGKTTLLSYIVDAWHEIARPHFQNEFEGKENKYYRISSPIFNINTNEPSFVYIRFKIHEKIVDYVDIRNDCSQQQYDIAIPLEDKIPFDQLQTELKQARNIKFVSNLDKEMANNIFSNNVITYFPAYRYETPGYLNDPYKVHLDFAKEHSFSGYLGNPLEVVTGLTPLANWIMDVVLDMDLYKQTQTINGRTLDLTPERNVLWNSLNQIISQALISKNKEGGSLRFGIGRRNSGSSRIVVMRDKEGESTQVYPTIFNMSSGEVAMFCLFGEILHQADKNRNNIALEQITGIVLIDEVDKHLHIKLQKEVLPLLFNLFPNIQFIISSHSPFLNMGFAESESTKTRATIIDLDRGGIRIHPQKNSIYQEVYQMMISENENYAKLYQELSFLQSKPILFVEDTYTQIYKVAYLKLKEIAFEENDLEEKFDSHAEFFIHGKGNRNNLQGFLDNPCMNEWAKKTIVGLFDFDDAYDNYQKLKTNWETKSENSRNGLYKKRKDCNVYALMMPIPIFRNRIAGKDQKVQQLEVELLLTDEKIQECYGESGYATEKIIDGLEIPKIKNKNDFWKKALVLSKDDFDAFQPLFSTLDAIFSDNKSE